MKFTTVKNIVFGAFAVIGGTLADAMGGWDTALRVLICAMSADYITGLLVALIWHNSSKTDTGAASSAAGFKGLVKKCAILIFVWFGASLDLLIGGTWVRSAVILFFTANEGLSILENMGAMGIEYPEPIREALEALKKEAKDKGKHEK